MSRVRKDAGGSAGDETVDTAEMTGGDDSGGAGDPVGTATELWLAEREEAIPDEFLSWIREDGSSAEGEPSESTTVGRTLEARGVEALRRAMESPGRVRESAFRLLTADAYLTWSAEALLDVPDPEAALEALVRRVAQEDR